MHKAVKKLQGRRAPPVSLLKGAEPYFRYRIIKSVREHYKVRGYAIETIDASKVKERAIVDALDTSTLFGSDKLVIIINTEKLKGKVPNLTKYLEDPSDSTIAVFDYAFPPRKKDPALTPLGKALVAKAYTYESNPLNPYKREQDKWLIEEAAAQGKTLPDGFARAIHLNTGESLFALHNALRKVLLHADGDVVEKADLIAVLTRTATNQTYELSETFGARDLKKCLKLLDALWHQDDKQAVLITKTLQNHIEKLIRAKSLLSYGLDSRDAAKVLNMSPWLFKEKLEPQLKRFKLSALLDTYDRLCEVDILVKGSGLSHRAILESFFVRSLT